MKMANYIKITFFTFIVAYSGNLQAQESLSHWSFDLFGGTGLTHYNVESDPRPVYGINLRYSLNPITSFYSTYYRGRFAGNGDDALGRSFEIDFNHYSLRSQINLLRLLDANAGFLANSALDVVFGLGVLSYDTILNLDESQSNSSEFQGQSGNTQVLIAGGSVRQYISRRFDFIAQFEFNFTGNDLLAGYDRVPGGVANAENFRSNAYSLFTVGFSVKLGSDTREHVSWQRSPPVTAQEQ